MTFHALNSQRLERRTAIVTGGARGIGLAVARRFAAEGATVAINDLADAGTMAAALAAVRAAAAEAGHGERPHLALAADVSAPRAVEAMVEEAVSAWGHVDILVNNAGIQAPTPGDSFDDAVLSRILAVNLVGAANCARAVARHLLARRAPGAIINTTSVHEIIPKPGYLAYSISKGGLANLTRTLALEFAAHGIRVNAVGPGATATELNKSWVEDPAARAVVESHIPMGFAAEADDMAPVFAFLASDEARYITGQTIFACGGLTLYADFQHNWAS